MITLVTHHLAASALNHRRKVNALLFPVTIIIILCGSLSLSLLLREATGAFPIGWNDDIGGLVLLRSSSPYWIAMCSASSVRQRTSLASSFQIGKDPAPP